MNNAVLRTFDNLTELQAALAVARGYLDGHEDLQKRFDVMFQHVTNSTVDLIREVSARANK